MKGITMKSYCLAAEIANADLLYKLEASGSSKLNSLSDYSYMRF